MARATFRVRQAIAPVSAKCGQSEFQKRLHRKESCLVSAITIAKFMTTTFFFSFFLSFFPIQFATRQLLHVSSTLSYNADSHKLVQKICAEVRTSTSTAYHFRDCKVCKLHFCVQ